MEVFWHKVRLTKKENSILVWQEQIRVNKSYSF
mgnify:CR=1 FL=1|jgi:hypothetical protein